MGLTLLTELQQKKSQADIWVETLGNFHVYRNGDIISPKEWGREKTVQLFQFLITSRNRNRLHKEQIIDRIWPEADMDQGNRDFKVAMHGINKVLEPDRKSREEPKYIERQGLTYQLNKKKVWIDIESANEYIEIGNGLQQQNKEVSIQAYKNAIELYGGIYLPDRVYQDWTSAQREKTQILILNAYIILSELLLDEQPSESIRLAQEALSIDHTSEEAYRIQMQAYSLKNNRPLAIKTYDRCKSILKAEFGIEPLPETKALLEDIRKR